MLSYKSNNWTCLVIYSTLRYMLIAIDTGGSKTIVANLDDEGNITAKVKFPTPRDTTEYTASVQNAIREVAGTETPRAIAVAMPGVIIDNIAVSCPNLGWENFDIRPALSDLFPGVPIGVENDANLAGLGETYVLDPMPDFSLYITVSTGIGTGFTSNGKIDPSLRLSEGGHMFIANNGELERWETFASGSAIYRTYNKYARDITDEHAWDEIAERLSRGLLAIIPLTQPHIVIFGGSIGTFFDRYGSKLETILREKLPPHIPCPPLVQAQYPNEAVIHGCYYHALNQLSDQATTN